MEKNSNLDHVLQKAALKKEKKKDFSINFTHLQIILQKEYLS